MSCRSKIQSPQSRLQTLWIWMLLGFSRGGAASPSGRYVPKFGECRVATRSYRAGGFGLGAFALAGPFPSRSLFESSFCQENRSTGIPRINLVRSRFFLVAGQLVGLDRRTKLLAGRRHGNPPRYLPLAQARLASGLGCGWAGDLFVERAGTPRSRYPLTGRVRAAKKHSFAPHPNRQCSTYHASSCRRTGPARAHSRQLPADPYLTHDRLDRA